MTPFLAYGIFTIIVLRPLAGHFAWWQVEHWWRTQESPDAQDWFIAIIAAVCWPIALVMMCTYFVLSLWARTMSRMKFGAERRGVRARERKRLSEIAARIDKEFDEEEGMM